MPVEIAPIESNVLRDYVEEAIIQSLISKDLAPGDQINEAEIARQAGISRGPVREAIQHLVGEDILVSIPQRGTFVKQWSVQDIQEVYSLRANLESYAARLVAERITQSELDELIKIVEDMMGHAERNEEAAVYEKDLLFHQRTTEISRHQLLGKFLGKLRRQINVFIRFDAGTTPNLIDYASNHLLLLDALKSRDPGVVENVFRTHIVEIGEALAKRYVEKQEQRALLSKQDPDRETTT